MMMMMMKGGCGLLLNVTRRRVQAAQVRVDRLTATYICVAAVVAVVCSAALQFWTTTSSLLTFNQEVLLLVDSMTWHLIPITPADNMCSTLLPLEGMHVLFVIALSDADVMVFKTRLHCDAYSVISDVTAVESLD
jgi:hypothetical protein